MHVIVCVRPSEKVGQCPLRIARDDNVVLLTINLDFVMPVF